MTAVRRERALALTLVLAGALVLAMAAARPWLVTHLAADGLFPARRRTAGGTSVDPLPRAAAIAGVAGVLAIVSTRGAVRRVVGAVLDAIALAVVVRAFTLAANPPGHLPASAIRGTDVAAGGHVGVTVWPWVAVVAGFAMAAGGALTAARSGAWPGPSSRYERSSPEAPGPAATPDDEAYRQWAELDAGRDPTA